MIDQTLQYRLKNAFGLFLVLDYLKERTVKLVEIGGKNND